MKFSAGTTGLINGIKEFAGGKVGNEYDLSVLFECSYFGGNRPLFEELAFSAKFMNGLFGIITDEGNGDKMEKLLPEFTANLENFLELLRKNLENADAESAKHFREKYFRPEPGIIPELINLIRGLSVCKDYLNERKFGRD